VKISNKSHIKTTALADSMFWTI